MNHHTQTGREPSTRIAVDVSFLRIEPGQALPPARALPEGCAVVRVEHPTVGFYRYLYDGVGQDYCWWLRRATPDAGLRALLADPAVSIFVLYRGGQPAGFFELDARGVRDVNLSYFGLLPHAVGTGLGAVLLSAAVSAARTASATGAVRVNTCTADHPRALPTYLAAGFVLVRTVRELWDIPDRLGLPIPNGLRA